MLSIVQQLFFEDLQAITMTLNCERYVEKSFFFVDFSIFRLNDKGMNTEDGEKKRDNNVFLLFFREGQ